MIIHGDALSVLRAMEPDSADCCITDPDYGVGIDYSTLIQRPRVKHKTYGELASLIVPVLKETARICRRDEIWFWAGGTTRMFDFYRFCEEAGREIRHMGIWYKPNGGGPTGNGLARRYEVFFWLRGKEKRSSEWKYMGDVLGVTRHSREGIAHPTQKPEALIERIIKFVTNEGDLILDPFLGSGTLAVVATKMNRRCIGIEINAEYVEMAQGRMDAIAPLFKEAS